MLAVTGVEYIQDAVYIGIDNEEYPAIAISTNEQAVEQIKNYDFVIAVSPLAGIYVAPATSTDDETTQARDIRQTILAGIIVLSILALIIIVYLLIKHRRHVRLN